MMKEVQSNSKRRRRRGYYEKSAERMGVISRDQDDTEIRSNFLRDNSAELMRRLSLVEQEFSGAPRLLILLQEIVSDLAWGRNRPSLMAGCYKGKSYVSLKVDIMKLRAALVPLGLSIDSYQQGSGRYGRGYRIGLLDARAGR